jgi:hypothetical protein
MEIRADIQDMKSEKEKTKQRWQSKQETLEIQLYESAWTPTPEC